MLERNGLSNTRLEKKSVARPDRDPANTVLQNLGRHAPPQKFNIQIKSYEIWRGLKVVNPHPKTDHGTPLPANKEKYDIPSQISSELSPKWISFQVGYGSAYRSEIGTRKNRRNSMWWYKLNKHWAVPKLYNTSRMRKYFEI
jgi:hypothetical protein